MNRSTLLLFVFITMLLLSILQESRAARRRRRPKCQKCPVCPGFGLPPGDSARCSATGDPHYTTFDGLRYDFMGKCRYVLAKHTGGKFIVLQKNEPCGGGKATCTKAITVIVNGVKIQAVRGSPPSIDGHRVLQNAYKRGVYVFIRGREVKVTAQLGLTVTYNGVYNVHIDLSSRYKRQVQGLCGNYNGRKTDDFTTKRRRLGTANAFGNYWKFKSCSDSPQVPNPCKSLSRPKERRVKYFQRKCALLRLSPVFRRCNRRVNPLPFILNCNYDVCSSLGISAVASVCQSYEAYLEDCRVPGVALELRKKFKICRSPCATAPCFNGGKCIKGRGRRYKCLCPPGYKGKRCEGVKCSSVKLDVLYVVDSSGSVGESNFKTMKNFIVKLNGKFAISPAKTRIGLMEYGMKSHTKVVFCLGAKPSLAAVNKAVDALKYANSPATYTGFALEQAENKVFTGKNGDRPKIRNVLILLTDGAASDKITMLSAAKRLKASGVKIITVAIGKKTVREKFAAVMKEVASDKSLAFEAEFNSLGSISDALAQGTCDASA